MALILGDGFDHYGISKILQKWDATAYATAGIGTSYGRLGSSGIRIEGAPNGGLFKNIPVTNSSYGFLGVAVYVPGFGAYDRALLAVSDGVTAFGSPLSRASIWLGIDGTITWREWSGSFGNSVLASSAPGRVAANAWNYIELKAKVHNTAGFIEVRVNETVVLTQSNVNTRRAETSNNFFTRLWLGGSAGSAPDYATTYFDDFVYADDTGARNNTYLGDIALQAIYPNGAGPNTDWGIGGSAPAATNWQSVNEHDPDDDVTYVSSNTIGATDLYEMDDITNTASDVKGLLCNGRVRKDDAGARGYTLLTKSSSTIGEVAVRTAPYGAYVNQQDAQELNPDTGNPWTVAEVNAMKAGVRLKS